MNAKQKAIQAAYGENWEKVSPFVNPNGYCLFEYHQTDLTLAGVHYTATGFKQFEVEVSHKDDVMYWRPKSLFGIENNNGWIRHDEEKPEIEQRVFYCIEGIPSPVPCDYHPNMPMCSLMTHWKPADPPKPPIY